MPASSSLAPVLPTGYTPRMRLWYFPGEQTLQLDHYFNRQIGPIVAVTLGFALFLLLTNDSASFAGNHLPFIQAQQSTRASPYVGSAMAVLATLEQAQVLPPEGSREADRVIQSVIQLQSVFAKSTNPFIQDFAQRAVAAKYGEQAPTILDRFRSNGWTAEMLEALADTALPTATEEQQQLATGLQQVNLSVDDFTRFLQLVRDGRSAFATRGNTFEEIYTSRRNTMPGGAAR